MSFESWLQEFYPVPADEVAQSTDLACVEHAIKKWEGITPTHLEKHGVRYFDFELLDDEGDSLLSFDGETCALCQRYSNYAIHDISSPQYRCIDDQGNECPIIRTQGFSCHSTYLTCEENPIHLLQLLNDVKDALIK